MLLQELFESLSTNKQILVVYPGRYQPPHKGHKAVYDHLCKEYGQQNVYICTSDKVDPPRSPFNFQEKLSLWKLMGVDASHVIQTVQPYVPKELLDKFELSNIKLIFAVSEKDMAEDPRFQFKPKKDGSPSYFQPLSSLNDMQTADAHGYITTVPTVNFTVLGKPMQSATEIRAQFAEADPETKKKIVKDLFGVYSDYAFKLLSNKII